MSSDEPPNPRDKPRLRATKGGGKNPGRIRRDFTVLSATEERHVSWLPLGPTRFSLRLGFSRQAILLILNGLRDAVGRKNSEAARFRVVADVELAPGDDETMTLTLELRAEERVGE